MISQTFTPTILQKLLGRQYKWWYVLKYQIKSRTTYQIDNTLFALGNILTLLGTILTWYVASSASLGDSAFAEKLTYFIVGTMYISIINCWPSFYGYSIKNGKHTSDLLLPQNIFLTLWGKWFGMAIYQNIVVFSLILLFSPFWLFYIQQPVSLDVIFFTILLLPISHICLFFLELIVGFSAFFIVEINGLTLNYGFISKLFSGQLFPLVLLIPSFWLNLNNPFAYLFYHPMQIYLGKYNLQQTLLVFAGGIAWCIVLYFLAKLVFKAGLKRNESVGL